MSGDMAAVLIIVTIIAGLLIIINWPSRTN